MSTTVPYWSNMQTLMVFFSSSASLIAPLGLLRAASGVRGSQMLLRSQRQLDHPLQELIGRQADEIVQDQLLGVEAHQVAQLQRLVARGIDEIAVGVVDDDDVALGV